MITNTRNPDTTTSDLVITMRGGGEGCNYLGKLPTSPPLPYHHHQQQQQQQQPSPLALTFGARDTSAVSAIQSNRLSKTPLGECEKGRWRW